MTPRHGPRSIGMVFEHFASAPRPVWHLDRPFDIAPDSGVRFTVAGLATLVEQTSAALWEAGLRAGDRLAIVKDNHFDVVLLAAAAARIGALPAMTSGTIEPEILRKMMDRLDPGVLVAGPAVLAGAQKAGVELVGARTRVLVAGAGSPYSEALDGPVTTVHELLDADVPAANPAADDKPMICTHTSGTTGVPKYVVHSATTLLGVLTKLETMRIPFLSIRPTDTVASCISFVHGRAITWAAAQLARPPGEVVVLAESDPVTVAATLRRHPPSTLEACPNIFQRWEGMARTEPDVFASVRGFINTFDAIHPRTVRTFLEVSKQRMPVWGQVWGQTEVGPVCMGLYTRGRVNRSRGSRKAVTSDVGRSIPFVTGVKVVDARTRKQVPRGTEGMVLVRTAGRCLTYLGEDDRHREKIWDGWWNTGDIGVRSRGGMLRIIDREVDVIPGVSGIELESVLLERLPDATEVIVLGVPGRPPVPVLSTADGALDPAAWRRATADLPQLDDPVLIGWEDFPRTGTWKVRRPVLRERLFGTTQTFGTGRWT
ncbi:MAG: class I adenylate-forming enzyme family protein [Mycobacteriales bacterium]